MLKQGESGYEEATSFFNLVKMLQKGWQSALNAAAGTFFRTNRKNYRFLKKHLPRVQLYYALSRPIRISGSWNCCVTWVPALMLLLTARSELWQQWVLTASV